MRHKNELVNHFRSTVRLLDKTAQITSGFVVKEDGDKKNTKFDV